MDGDVQNDRQNSSDLFPPAKRRKFYRKRTDLDDEEAPKADSYRAVLPLEPMTVDQLIARNGHNTPPQDQAEEESALSITDILRQRKVAARRRGGIEFTNHPPSNSTTPQPSDALVEKEDETPADIKLVIERFAPQTGQVTDTTNKHMMAYIDSELAKRQRQTQSTSTFTQNSQALLRHGALIDTGGIDRQPAALGKLHEVDLGPDATLRNIALTEAAQRKLDGTAEPELDSQKGKPRLRRDGKPYGWRKQRNSDAIKRDKLVEEVMQETRLEIYDEPDEDEGANNGDQAADDRIAEQFRREFMDAVSSRKQKTGQEKKGMGGKGKVVDERPKGPKLGGSRSARAAMREKEEAAAKKR